MFLRALLSVEALTMSYWRLVWASIMMTCLRLRWVLGWLAELLLCWRFFYLPMMLVFRVLILRGF